MNGHLTQILTAAQLGISAERLQKTSFRDSFIQIEAQNASGDLSFGRERLNQHLNNSKVIRPAMATWMKEWDEFSGKDVN